jgi:hypothetical protein
MPALRYWWCGWLVVVGPVVCECSRIDEVRLSMVDVTCSDSRVTQCLHLHVKASEDSQISLVTGLGLADKTSHFAPAARVKSGFLLMLSSFSTTSTMLPKEVRSKKRRVFQQHSCILDSEIYGCVKVVL